MALKITTYQPNQSILETIGWTVTSPIWVPFWIVKKSINYCFSGSSPSPGHLTSSPDPSAPRVSSISRPIISREKELKPKYINPVKEELKVKASEILYPKLQNYLISFSLLTLVLQKNLDEHGKLNNALFEMVQIFSQNGNRFSISTFKTILRKNDIQVSFYASCWLYFSYYLLFRWIIASSVPVFCNHFLDVIFNELFDQTRKGSQGEILINLVSSFNDFIKNYADLLEKYQKRTSNTPKEKFFQRTLEQLIVTDDGTHLSQQELYEKFSKFIIDKFVLSIKDTLFIRKQTHNINLLRKDNKLLYLLILPYAILIKILFVFTLITDYVTTNIIYAFVKNLAPTLVETVINTMKDPNNQCTMNKVLIVQLEKITESLSKTQKNKVSPFKEVHNEALQTNIRSAAKNVARFMKLNARENPTSSYNIVPIERLFMSSLIEQKLPDVINDELSEYLHPQEFSDLITDLLIVTSNSFTKKTEFARIERIRTQEKLNQKINNLFNEAYNQLGRMAPFVGNRFLGWGFSAAGRLLLTARLRDKYIKAGLNLSKDRSILQSLFNYVMLSAVK